MEEVLGVEGREEVGEEEADAGGSGSMWGRCCLKVEEEVDEVEEEEVLVSMEGCGKALEP